MRFLLLIVAASLSAHGFAQDDLAKAAQNPIASLISVPIQSNNDFDWGPDGEWFSVSNIQPVIPLELNDDWNLVTRTIVPIIFPAGSYTFTGQENRHRRHTANRFPGSQKHG